MAWEDEIEWPSMEEFEKGQKAFSLSHAEPMDVPFWEFMVRHRMSSWTAMEHYKPEALFKESTWSFARLGCTVNVVRQVTGDRLVWIGGVEEDNRTVFNDVVVEELYGKITIYGYRHDVLPPLVGHTATASLSWPDWIVIIGRRGQLGEREYWRTPVYRLSLADFTISEPDCKGDEPAWIAGHSAMLLDESTIRIAGGEVLTPEGEFVPNEDEFDLSLGTWEWTRRKG